MWRNLKHKEHHKIFKVITLLMVLILSFTTINSWDMNKALGVVVCIFLYNFITNISRVQSLGKERWMGIKIIGNFILTNAFLYYTQGFSNSAYILYYFYIIIMVTMNFGKIPGVIIGGISFLASLKGMEECHQFMNGCMVHLYLYAGALIIGSFCNREGKRNTELGVKAREFEALYKISKIVDEFPDTGEILTNITKVVVETMEVRASLIMLYDEERDQLVAQSGYGVLDEVIGNAKFGPGKGVERSLIDQNKMYVFSNNKEEWDYEEEIMSQCKMDSMAAVPLIFKNRIIGTLSIYHNEILNLSEEKKKLFYMMASRIGIIVENDKLYKQVKESAITDGLTGLINHNQFYEKLKYEMEGIRNGEDKLFLLMIDIDKFKSFNDTYGHLVGDQVLTEMAKTIKNSIRETDVAARYGGEEFAVILPHATYEIAAIVADRIRYNVKLIGKNMDVLKDKGIEITVSIGLACYPNCTNDIHSLVDIADIRMYRGKEMGGDQVIA